ncbi:MAG: UDP-glucose 4-epimerase GalE [Acidimicrobiia bacterium]
MTVLVTGGAGYIGSHTVRALRAAGTPVVVLDSLELGHVESVLDTPLEVGDIADAALVAHIVHRYDVDSVVHFAGYKAAGESMDVPGKYFDNNVARTASLLDTLRETGVERFVFSSSCSVYGTPTTLPVDEQHPTGPESPYAESKLLVERMLRWFDECHGLRSVSLRYFNAAGASADARLGEDSPRPLNLVPLAMLSALGKIDALSVYGTDYPTPDGTCVRDYIHVDDLADAHVRALNYLADGGASTALNVGTGRGSSVLEVIEGAKTVSGVDFPVKLVERRPGDPSAVWADNTRVREVLGWEARYALDEILTSAWAWHSSHPDGYATR